MFKVHETKVRPIRQGDRRFMINDGIVQYPRAMIHILPECPRNVRETLNWAVSQGYVKPVAHVTERELIFMGLTDDAS